MKLQIILFLALITIMIYGCNKVESDEFVSKVDVAALKKAMYEYNALTYQYDRETVNKEISKLMIDLKANPTATDKDGHLENVKLLIKRINELDGFSAKLFCYACIETYPSKSDISIEFKYNNKIIKRQMFVMPAMGKVDDLLHFAGIQMSYDEM